MKYLEPAQSQAAAACCSSHPLPLLTEPQILDSKAPTAPAVVGPWDGGKGTGMIQDLPKH